MHDFSTFLHTTKQNKYNMIKYHMYLSPPNTPVIKPACAEKTERTLGLLRLFIISIIPEHRNMLKAINFVIFESANIYKNIKCAK